MEYDETGTILLGKDLLTGKKIEMDISALATTHTHIMGRSGYGKTYLLKRIIRDLLQADCGVLVLDGKNELSDDVIDCAAAYKLGNRTIEIDPKAEYTVGLNYLEPMGKTRPNELANLVMEAIKKFLHEEGESKPWLDEWGPSSFQPLIESGMTLLELFDFTGPDERFRQAILRTMGDGFFKKKWEHFQVFTTAEQARILNVIRTRATTFWTNPFLKALFGQERTTIDWLKVMNEGGVVVARLGEGGGLTADGAAFIGAVILHQVKTIAPERGINPKRPFFVVADEFQKFATSDFADGLERLRGFGVHFCLSHQLLAQLSKYDAALLDSCLANASNKIYFSISAKDSLTIAEELFTGWIHGDEIKDELVQTKFRPVETTRTIVSESDSSSFSSSDQKSMVVGISRGSGGTTEDPTTIETSSSSDSSSSGATESRSNSYSQAQVPWYEQEEFREVTGRTYRSPDELRERYKGYLVRQDRRCFQWKLHQAFPRPMQAPEVKPIDVSYWDKKNSGKPC